MGTKVTVRAAEWHTHQGKAYDVGDTYQVDDDLVTTLKVQGKAFAVSEPTKTKDQRAATPAASPAADATTESAQTYETKNQSPADAPAAARATGRKARTPRLPGAERKPRLKKTT